MNDQRRQREPTVARWRTGTVYETRTGGLCTVARVLVVWLLTAGALHLLSAVLPGFTIEGGDGSVLLAAALIGLTNALVWPTLIRVALPFTVLTLGLGVLLLNGAVVLAVSQIEPGMHVGIWAPGSRSPSA